MSQSRKYLTDITCHGLLVILKTPSPQTSYKLICKAKKTANKDPETKYRTLRRKVQSEISKFDWKHLNGLLDPTEDHHSSKNLWRLGINGVRFTMCSLKMEDKIADDPTPKDEVLNVEFSSIFTKEDVLNKQLKKESPCQR